MITKEQADQIVLQNDNFYVKEHNINGVKVWSYNYLMNEYNSFETPIHKELRGLTFVEGRKEPYLSIKKFWNLNEVENTQYKTLKNKNIRAVLEKADGSLIQVIDVNGEIITKTKMSFESPEALLAQSVLDKDPDLKFFILDLWAKNWQPLFEIVSPENKIVLEYDKTSLKLIAVRDFEGNFIPLDGIINDLTYNIDIVQIYDNSMDECIQICKNATDLEGFVIRFHDEEQSMIKIKSIWYLERHRLVSDSDRLIEVFKSILDETLDDMLSLVSEKKRTELQKINDLVVKYIDKETKRIFDIVNNSVDRKKTAQKYINDEYFGVIMGSLKCPKADLECVQDKLKKYLKNKINREQKAKNFIERIKNEKM